eukprot:565265_1
MSSQSITKQSMREMTTGFSLFSTEQKNESVSPRKVFKAKRRYSHNNAPLNHTNDQIFTTDRDSKFTQMTDTQYKEYQQCSMSKRMKRKMKMKEMTTHRKVMIIMIIMNNIRRNTMQWSHGDVD